MKRPLIAALVSWLAATPVNAALYEIDTSFGTNGRYNLPFPGSDFRTLAHLPRPDGGSLAVVTYDGNQCPALRHCLGIYYFNAAGQFINVATVPTNTHTFSKRTGGIVLDPFLVKSATIDSQSRIIIAGTEQFGTVFQFKVIRLLAGGQPDPSFDGDGIALPGNFTAQNEDVAEAVAVDSNDRILVAGRAKFSNTDTDFAVLKLTTAGVLDTDFSTDGKLTIAFDLNGAGRDGVRAMDLRNGGQIYLAGGAVDNATGVQRIALAKLLPSGSLDSNFCATTCSFQGSYTGINNGRRILYFGLEADNLDDFVESMAVNISGEMVYAGSHAVGPSEFKIFTQKVALNGDYANEGLSDIGLTGPLTAMVGGIRYFNKNNATSDLVLTGSTGPNREFFFAQGLSPALAPRLNWGSIGTNNSAVLYTATGGSSDSPGDRPALPSVDASGRILLGGSYKENSSAVNYAINVMRFKSVTQSEQLFRNGFE